MHPAIAALELKELPAPEADLLKKILSDNLVTLRAQELMVAHLAADAIREMSPLERAALIKRISPQPKLATSGVSFGVSHGKNSITGRPYVYAARGNEVLNFDGKPESLKHLNFFNQLAPAHIAAEYAAVYNPNNAPLHNADYYRNMQQPVQDKATGPVPAAKIF